MADNSASSPAASRPAGPPSGGGGGGGGLQLPANPPNVGTGRQKTALKPGHSLMDWIRLTNSGEDLTGLRGQLKGVTPTELAKHNTKEDCWMAIHDRVYDVTRYMSFHPGGADELLRGAGTDATALFNEVHRWVNYSSMLSRCLIGPLVMPRSGIRRRKTIDHQALPSHKAQGLFSMPRPMPSKKPSWDWTEDSDGMTLVITYPSAIPSAEFSSLSVMDSLLKLRNFVPPKVHNFHISILSGLFWDGDLPEVEGNCCRLRLRKRCPGDALPTVGQVHRDDYRALKDLNLEYLQCHLVSRTPVTHDSVLFCIEWPEGMHMRVPVGHHVRVRAQIEGIEMARSYTPVCSSIVEPTLSAEELSARHLYLMMKIYPGGCLTPKLDELKPGDVVSISPPEGSFMTLHDPFSTCQRLLLLAAGTGFTPMARLLRLFLHERQSGSVCLIFFNKTEADILWRSQLELLREQYPTRLDLMFVLSQPDAGWTGPRGRVSEAILREAVPEAPTDDTGGEVAEDDGMKSGVASMFACVCGPDMFTDLAVSLLVSTLHLAESQIHAFKG